jgi:Amt family ammonium transporter
MGVVAVGAFVFLVGLIGWAIINVVVGLRVSADEELEGLDIGEHGNYAYPDFQMATMAEHGAR